MTTKAIYPDEQKLAIWHYVSNIRYLGPVRFRQLLKRLGKNIDQIFEMKESELLGLKGVVTPQVIKSIKDQKAQKAASERFAKDQLVRAKNCGCSIVLLDNSAYPNYLRRSKFCHPILYARGNLEPFINYDRSLSILGTRKADPESLKIARIVAAGLSKVGWVIISGMAKGIDASAHEGALDSGGKTIAVLGSGIDKPYPRECRNLYERISKDNLVVSEFPLGARPTALQLKKRNKTTVALSLGAFIVQSSSTGGAMNAVKACLEQKKPLFSIPHDGKEYSGNRQILASGGYTISTQNAISIIEGVCLALEQI
jgi:DNA processing protein